MFEVNGREIGPNCPPYFIADIGANHDGSLRRANELIKLAANYGADAVKFQNFRAETIVSRRGFEELKVGHQAKWEKSVYETYTDYSMPLHWIETLASTCDRENVAFMTTPYDLELVDKIDPYVPAWKIGSGDITWHKLIAHVRSKGKPMFVATGASTLHEVNDVIQGPLGNRSDPPFALLHCNTNYTGTSGLRYLNLNVLRQWRAYSLPLGLSDHTPGTEGILVVCAAIALGACVVEKHFTDNPDRKGPDHGFAMTPVEWMVMVEDAYATFKCLGDGYKKVEENEQETRIVQRRALRYRGNLKAGMVLGDGDMIPTRPCPEGALQPYKAWRLLGRTLTRDVEADTLVQLEDIQ